MNEGSSGWRIQYPGVDLTGCYNSEKTIYQLKISPPTKTDIPEFEIRLPTPVPNKTTVLLPGATILVQMTQLEEVSVFTDCYGVEVERVNAWFRKLVDEEGYVSILKEVYENGCLYSVEARAGVVEEIDEGFVIVSVYKFLDGGSVCSEVSECGYERFLEGL